MAYILIIFAKSNGEIMKRKGIILGLLTIATIGTSCGNSKAVVVGAGEKSETNEAKVEKKENEILNNGRLERVINKEIKIPVQSIKITE